jgi:hypothetical protein
MALATKSHEVGQMIGLLVSLNAKLPKRNYVSNRQFFRQIIPVNAATLACVSVSITRLIPLLSPVRPVIRTFATFPVRTFLGTKVVGKPLQTTRIATEPLGCVANGDNPLFATNFTGISHLIRIAFLRTVDA